MLGPSFTKLVESDVIYVYGKGDGKGESRVMEYIYHCNVQKPRYAFVNELNKIMFLFS